MGAYVSQADPESNRLVIRACNNDAVIVYQLTAVDRQSIVCLKLYGLEYLFVRNKKRLLFFALLAGL